jgi:hypothetical protein
LFASAHPTRPGPVPVSTIATLADTNASTIDIQKRGNLGGIYMCKEKFFKGECTYFQVPHMDECYNLDRHWMNSISSFGPDEPKHPLDAFTCSLFARAGCEGMKAKKEYPGTGDLGIYNMREAGVSLSCSFGSEYDGPALIS